MRDERSRLGSASKGSRALSRRTFLGASAAVAIAACAPTPQGGATASSSSSTPKRGGSLTILSGQGVSTLDPFFQTAGAWELSQQVFEPLVDFTGPNPDQPVGKLAESWTETGTTLTFKLRQGVKFHNGREFTSQDVVDTFARAKDRSVGHQLFSIIDPTVASVDATDRYTARINYKALHPARFGDLAACYIIPKENWQDVTKAPIGAGPFKFVSYAPGSAVNLVRFEEYWQRDRPYLDKITLSIMPDEQARAAALTGGSGDAAMPNMPRANFDRLAKDPSLLTKKVPSPLFDDIILNCAQKPFDNQFVRQAMNYTIDRDKINKLVYFGTLDLAQREFPKGHWAFNETANSKYKYDLDKAKALLAQGGVPNGFETSINVGSKPEFAQTAQLWKEDLAKVGVKLQINEYETAVFAAEYNKNLWKIQAFTNGPKRDPSSIVGNSPYRQVDNRARIDTQPFFEDYKKALADGLSSNDLAVRAPAYKRLQDILAESGHIIVLGFTPVLYGTTKNVRDVVFESQYAFQSYTSAWIAS